MKITLEQVKKTAALAKLPLEGKELVAMVAQLQEFLDYVEVLKKMPPAKASTPLALDEPVLDWQGDACLGQEEVLALAPDSGQGMVRVPRVIEYE